MRCATDGKYPRYIVWENVPGAFSSNKGADFQSVLEEICSVKGYEIHTPRPGRWANAGEIVADDFSLAWRVFDAQYWGVPQRRRRIYLVVDLDGGRAGKILFESESLCGNFAPCRHTTAATTARAARGSGTSRGTARVTQSLTHSFGCGGADDNRAQGGFYIPVVPPLTTTPYADNAWQEGRLISVARCLTSRAERYDFETETLIPTHGVRRITPLEAERLQGFPDGWTNIPWRGRPAPDRLRYRALGNAMCVNVMRWLGERIARYGHA